MSIAEKLVTIAENQGKIFNAGKDSEWNKFWDAFQINGTRTAYNQAFVGNSFSFDNFFPKYDINAVGNASQMFYSWRTARTTSVSGSLKQRLTDCGVKLDTSKAIELSRAFSYCAFTELPTIDLTGLTGAPTYLFSHNSELKTIEKIILNASTPLSTNMFTENSGLKNVVFEGVIGSSVSFQHSKLLTRASIENVVSCLSASSTGTTLTLSQTAVNNAFTTDEWNALIADKTNWTFSLV